MRSEEAPAEVRTLALPTLGALRTSAAGVHGTVIVGLLLVFGAVFYLAPWPGVYLPALAAVVVLAWLRLDLVLILVPLFAPFYYHPKSLGSRQFSPGEIFLVLDVGVALAYVAVRRSRAGFDWAAVRSSPFLLPGGLLLIAASLSTLLAADRHHALEWYRWTILEPLAFFALLMLVQREAWQWRLILSTLIGAALVATAIALAQFGAHEGLSVVPGGSLERVRGPYGSPDNLGLLYDRAMPLALAVALMARLSLRQRLIPLLATAVLAVGLALTYSRGAQLAVAVTVLLLLAVTFRWGRWVALAALLAAGGLLLVRGHALAHAFNSGHQGTVQQRLDIWQSSLHMLRDHPILGVGPDNFIHYYAPSHQAYVKDCAPGLAYMQPAAWREPCQSHPHNEIFDFWLSTGVLGLLAFVWIQVLFWRSAVVSWSRIRPTVLGPWIVGAMAAMLASLLHGLVDNVYFLPDLSIVFWLLCALISFVYGRRQAADAT